jgi:hypothetical protein
MKAMLLPAGQGGESAERRDASDIHRAAELRRRASAGENKAALAREFCISRQSFYSYMKADRAMAQAATTTGTAWT